MGEPDAKCDSKRVHFVCRASGDVVSKLQPALENALAIIHEEMQEKVSNPRKFQHRNRSRSPRRDSHGGGETEVWRPPAGPPSVNDMSGDSAPWRPPTGEAPAGLPPPPAWGPHGPPPPGYPWGPPPPGYPMPPWMGGPPGAPPPPWMGGPPGPPGSHPPPPPPGSLAGPPGNLQVEDAPRRGGSKPRRRRREEKTDDPDAKPGDDDPDAEKRGHRRRRRDDDGGDDDAKGGKRRRREERPEERREGGGEAGRAPSPSRAWVPPTMHPMPPAAWEGGAPPDFGMGVPPPGFGFPTPGMAFHPEEAMRAAALAHGAPPPPAAPSAAAAGGGGFLDSLPPGQLTAPERDLADAVNAFLATWGTTHEEGSHPNMVHLGADKGIRESKALVLPREVSLKAWIKQRLTREVIIDGQSVKPVAK